MVIKAYYPENLGRFGTVEGPVANFPPYDWKVIPQSSFLARSFQDGVVETTKGTGFEDYKLLPIPPGSPDEETEETQELEDTQWT